MHAEPRPTARQVQSCSRRVRRGPLPRFVRGNETCGGPPPPNPQHLSLPPPPSPSLSPRVKLGGSLAGKDSSSDSSTSSSRCRSLSSISSSGRFALMVFDQLILIFSSCKNRAQQLDDMMISG